MEVIVTPSNIVLLNHIRLLGGPSSAEGRIEIYADFKPGGPQWARLCDEGWTDVTADIACRQLGFTDAVSVTDRSFYGEGTINDVVRIDGCSPDQTRLLPGCHVRNGGRRCNRGRDAGVACAVTPDPPTAQGMHNRGATTTFMAPPTSTPPSTTTAAITTRAIATSPVPTTTQLMTSLADRDALTTDETPEASTLTSDPITTMFTVDVKTRAITIWTLSVVIVFICLVVAITLVVIFLRNRCRNRKRKADDVDVNVEAPSRLSNYDDEDGEYQYAAPPASVALSGQGSTVSLAGSEVQVDEGFYTLPANAAATETNPYQELNVKSNTFAGLQKLKKRPPQQPKDAKARKIGAKNPPQKKKKPVIDVVRNTDNREAAARDAENEYDLPLDTSKSRLTMVNNATYGDYGGDQSTTAAQSDLTYMNDIDLKTLHAESTYATPDSGDADGVDNSENYYLVPNQESPYVNAQIGTQNVEDEEGNEYCAISRKPTKAI
ncbi:uncharacterized protein [Diadema setosum]|uniref:uncharacterized protein n=1 Tax=Diadema setosum TaxID=31175 RepID=UPI003B3A8322